jgi:hypothetical protein
MGSGDAAIVGDLHLVAAPVGLRKAFADEVVILRPGAEAW